MEFILERERKKTPAFFLKTTTKNVHVSKMAENLVPARGKKIECGKSAFLTPSTPNLRWKENKKPEHLALAKVCAKFSGNKFMGNVKAAH